MGRFGEGFGRVWGEFWEGWKEFGRGLGHFGRILRGLGTLWALLGFFVRFCVFSWILTETTGTAQERFIKTFFLYVKGGPG